MKQSMSNVIKDRQANKVIPRQPPRPGTPCPTVSVVCLRAGPLRRLAWIFGFGL
jgi:hypothetical protein